MSETNGTARWQVWVTAASVAVILVGALMTLYVQVNTAYTTAVELQGRVDRLALALAASESQVTQLCSALVEVETQFRASDQVRNLMHVNDLRTEAMLWRKSFGADYPMGDAYLPTIARDGPRPCG